MKFPQSIVKLSIVLLFAFSFFGCSKNATVTGNSGGPNPSVTVVQNVQYGSNKDLSGNMQALMLDVYIPANATANQTFPLVFFVHGGGFVGGDKESASIAMTTFAQSGFVGVSIDYRLDENIDASTDPCSLDSTVEQESVYMAVQDARAALRFLVANAAKYHIDVSTIFLNGNSAGAVALLNSYYLTQQDFNSIAPGIEAKLGGVDNADNNLTNTYTVTAIAANSGCLPNPAYITTSNVKPTIFFAGGEDSVIPIDQGHAYYCTSTMYIYGSRSLYKRMQQLSEPAVLHVDPTGGHGPYTEDFLSSNELCFFNSVMGKKVETGSYTALASSCP
jgi:acetyl esterase/lipase